MVEAFKKLKDFNDKLYKQNFFKESSCLLAIVPRD
jgi:hypothetical protein